MDKVICNNCGLTGHIYRDCKKPVSSFGIIIFRIDRESPEILMIQRKNSLCYIEFLRGKYNINDNTYITNLFSKCSNHEKQMIRESEFDNLWIDLWTTKKTVNIEIKDYLKKDYENSKFKFNKLLSSGKITLLLDKCNNLYFNTEWEFPKGRRNKNETNFETAKREFTEETGYTDNDYIIIDNINTIHEEYKSNNNVKYRHNYNIGYLKNLSKIPYVDEENIVQATEIKDIKWLNKTEALEKIRDYHTYRKKIINDIFDFIETIPTKISLI